MISVLVADDERLVRAGLRTILGSEPDIDVVGEAVDGLEAVDLAHRLAPDVVVMDIRMPRLDGIRATRTICSRPGAPVVLVVTTFDLDEYVFQALRAGATGFLLKDAPEQQLLAAVRSAVQGVTLVTPSVTRRLIETFASASTTPDPRLELLTEREREVLVAVARGSSNAEIATSLVIGEATVKTHVSRLLTKLDLTSRTQAVVLAYETGLVSPGDRATR